MTSKVIVFMIHRSRAQDAAIKLLLNGKTALKDLVFGYLDTDRHGAYNFWPLALRQFCWSHLQRDFTAISERDGQAGDHVPMRSVSDGLSPTLLSSVSIAPPPSSEASPKKERISSRRAWASARPISMSWRQKWPSKSM